MKIQKSWLHILPLELYLDLRGRIKLKIGIAQRLKKVEKKQILKEKMVARDTARELSKYR